MGSSVIGENATIRAMGLELTLPIELDDDRVIRRQRGFLWFGSFIVAVGLGWAAVTPVREIAIAPGELTPSGQGRVIQHLEGGVVERILVRDGQYVEEGQPLVRLSAALSQSDFAALAARHNALRQQKAQIEQVLANGVPALGALSLTAEQARVLAGRLASRAQEEQTFLARAEQRRAELMSLEREAVHLARILEIQSEQLRMRAELAESGYTSRKLLLEAEAQLEQSRQNASNNAGRQEAARKALIEAESQLAASAKDAARQWAEELAKVSAELAEVTESLSKHQDRLERLVVKAPVAGVIQTVVPKVPNEVLKPGDAVVHFVPASATLVAELRVRPNDIPHVAVGSPVETAINGSDPRKDGKLKGKIISLSPTTYQREQGEPYYRAIASIETTDRQLVAGMTVRGEVVTGDKSLLRYLLRPIYDGIDLAFRER